jgi:TolB-like protein/DNA-binding winged helix-turn-helix (wHTH) protein
MSLPPSTQGAALAGPVELGEFELDATTRRLTRRGTSVALTPKPFRVLVHLLENRHRLVTRGELLERFWEGGNYEEALTRAVSSVRKALDDHGEPARFIETRWAEGYRYVGPFALAASDRSPAPPASVPSSEPALRPSRLPRGRLLVLAVCLAAMTALAVLLTRPRTQPPTPIHRIAVLPLQNLGDPSQDYFSEGLTDGLVAALSRMEGLTVIARGSTRSFANGADPQETGRALRVPAYLTGTVRRDGGGVRVALRLIDTAEGRVLWAHETERATGGQDGTADEVARALALRLSARLHAPTPARPRSEAAYDHYLRGRHLWQQRNETALTQAISQFEAALASDPDFAGAHLGLAESWLLLPLYAGRAPLSAYPRARASAETALRLDPEAARAHAVLGVVASQFDWDWTAADAHFARAVALDPNDATALQWQAEAHCFRGRFDACARGLRAAYELDPLSPVLAMAQGFPARFAGDTATALRIFHAVEQQRPEFPFVHYQLGTTYSAAGNWERAINHYRQALPAFGLNLVGGQLAYACARSGRSDEAVRLRDAMLERSRRAYFPPVTLAAAELGLGNLEAALDHLEHALELHDDFLVYMRDDPHTRDLQGHPRFAALQARLGFIPSPRR